MKDSVIALLVVLLLLALAGEGRDPHALIEDTTLVHRSAEVTMRACPVRPIPPVAPHIPESVARGIV